jgi:beta-barrel assembly-enhancing protease
LTDERQGFDGYASHPSLGEEAVQGKIVFAFFRLRFVSDAATVEMPLSRLVIEKGSRGDERIFFCDPEQPDWFISTFDNRILESGPLLQQPHTQHQIRDMQGGHELGRRLKVTFAVLGGFIVAAMIVWMLMGLMVRMVVARVPPQWEKELGDSVMAELREHEVFTNDVKLKAKLDLAVAPLLRVLPKTGTEYKFYLIENPLPNAFALPGGHVMVNDSLIRMADRPEELAGVIAHEIAHVTEKHGFRKMISEAGPYLIVRVFLGGGRGTVGVLGGSSQLLVRQSFSQEYELEADAVGWDYLVKARIDPRGLADMLKKLQAGQGGIGMEQLGLGAFSSHPATVKRIQRLEAKWRKLKDKTGFITYEKPETTDEPSTAGSQPKS